MRVRQKTRWRELHLCRLQNNLHTRNANWETPKSNPNRLASQTTKHFERSQNATQQGIVFLTPPPRNAYHDFNSSQWPSKPNKITDYSSIAVTIRPAIFANSAPQKTGYSTQNPYPPARNPDPQPKPIPPLETLFFSFIRSRSSPRRVLPCQSSNGDFNYSLPPHLGCWNEEHHRYSIFKFHSSKRSQKFQRKEQQKSRP